PVTRNSHYFPSYEIMMDDLRDYRFYSEDMLHPNQVAIDYIWQQFKNVHLSESSYVVMDEIDSIQKGLAHRPFNPNTAQHQLFVEKLQQRIALLQKKYPFITLG
ncbi:MAG: GSCFA domain-containing protein, partial [Flavobacterium sp.]|nr:GSCFA domain-containing protein [Flavobacterium sp.]